LVRRACEGLLDETEAQRGGSGESPAAR
jgi:hypothetical protein